MHKDFIESSSDSTHFLCNHSLWLLWAQNSPQPSNCHLPLTCSRFLLFAQCLDKKKKKKDSICTGCGLVSWCSQALEGTIPWVPSASPLYWALSGSVATQYKTCRSSCTHCGGPNTMAQGGELCQALRCVLCFSGTSH